MRILTNGWGCCTQRRDRRREAKLISDTLQFEHSAGGQGCQSAEPLHRREGGEKGAMPEIMALEYWQMVSFYRLDREIDHPRAVYFRSLTLFLLLCLSVCLSACLPVCLPVVLTSCLCDFTVCFPPSLLAGMNLFYPPIPLSLSLARSLSVLCIVSPPPSLFMTWSVLVSVRAPVCRLLCVCICATACLPAPPYHNSPPLRWQSGYVGLGCRLGC